MMPCIQTIVVEDEPLAREGLLMYIAEVQFLEVKSVFESALEANLEFGNYPIDLIFLDIQMPRLSGLDFLKSLQKPPMIVITTAYPNYALQGFELDVVDYLVKPYSFERFLKAANKVRDLYLLQRAQETQIEKFFFIKCDNKFEKINFDEVMYVEGMENYVVIHTLSRKYITMMRMKEAEEILKPNKFIRIHKSYIVAAMFVTALTANEVIVNDKKLPISRERKNEVLAKIINSK